MVLLVELLAGLLSGERSWENETVATSEERPAHYSQTFIAISIEHFHERSTFLAAAERMIETLISSRPAEGFTKVRLPGTGAVDKEEDYRKNGVIVRDEEWEMLVAMASRLGLEVPAA